MLVTNVANIQTTRPTFVGNMLPTFVANKCWPSVLGFRPTVGDYKQKTCLSRHDTVLLNRLRIGHTRLTHSYLLSGDDLPECGTCQCPLTVKHILVECVDLKDVRKKHFVASSIKHLFDTIEAHKIIDFIKETCFYKQL